jgi:membrane-bound serine protease (ClpP class)
MSAARSVPRMRYCVAVVLTAYVTILLLPVVVPVEAKAGDSSAPVVLELKLDGVVAPILANYIAEGLADAAKRNAALVLITMDTPGGLSDSMTDIIHHILDSPVPVAVYVSPAGARGASAGFLILLSADVAAMAPGTRAGAATPILMNGWFSMPMDEVLRKKINHDATAFLRSFSEKRERNPKLAETAITEARAFTEKEALDGKMIDLVVGSKEELLRQVNGREITRFGGTKTRLSLDNYALAEFHLSARQQFLTRIVQPDALFLLLIIGTLGLYTEFTHPGMVAPGVIGGIAMLLALYAMELLPVNFAGILLIVLALVLFILEAKLTSHGVLLVGGIASMLLGTIFLIRSPLTPGGVTVGVALAATLPFAVLSVFLMRLVLKSRKWKSATGKEELIGELAIVTTAIPRNGQGMVRTHGELWRATSGQAITEGVTVRVVRVQGLQLQVEPSVAMSSEKQ